MFKVGIECESIEGKNPMFGVGRMTVKLLEGVSRRPELERDYRFILYFKDNVPEFPFLKAPIFEIKRVPVPFFKNRLFPIYYFALLPMRLWFDRPDVMFWPNYMLPIIAFGKSVVMLTEDVYYETHEGQLPFRYRLAYGIFSWWTAKFATRIMAISETSRKNLAKLYHINPDRIVINYLGVDTLPFFAQGFEGRRIKGNYLLFVGQMFPRRHAKETILAFEKLLANYSQILENLRIVNLRLIMVGPDKYPEAMIDPLIKQANDNLGGNAVVHKDYVSDDELNELYANAKALIYVSDREAFGLPPMEALSFGVPPIIADNELSHELFGARPEETKSLFGDYAFYSKSGDVDDITDAIKQALTDTRKIQNIKNSGPEFVKKYNWKSFADRWINIIQKCHEK
ncbi:MAG: glycosyltransferase family 4 protein [Candidatus Yanofskybacteria bacterium]|nr:glycosyltransferase family 4 protein [Candidatus Yanofskybacteria bacterium]